MSKSQIYTPENDTCFMCVIVESKISILGDEFFMGVWVKINWLLWLKQLEN